MVETKQFLGRPVVVHKHLGTWHQVVEVMPDGPTIAPVPIEIVWCPAVCQISITARGTFDDGDEADRWRPVYDRFEELMHPALNRFREKLLAARDGSAGLPALKADVSAALEQLCAETGVALPGAIWVIRDGERESV